jgi:hypothetical protein
MFQFCGELGHTFMEFVTNSLFVCVFQFCGELGHTFMEFVTNSGDYCQAQHE